MAFAVAAASATLCLRMRYSFCHRKPAGVAAPMKAKRSTATSSSGGWILVHTKEGQPYYYHALTRQSRWEKPEGVVLEKMEARIQQEVAERERKQQERMKELHEAEEKRKEEEGGIV